MLYNYSSILLIPTSKFIPGISSKEGKEQLERVSSLVSLPNREQSSARTTIFSFPDIFLRNIIGVSPRNLFSTAWTPFFLRLSPGTTPVASLAGIVGHHDFHRVIRGRNWRWPPRGGPIAAALPAAITKRDGPALWRAFPQPPASDVP